MVVVVVVEVLVVLVGVVLELTKVDFLCLTRCIPTVSACKIIDIDIYRLPP